jgi:hypothetical protein
MVWLFCEHDISANAEPAQLGGFLLPLILIKISRVIYLKEVVGLREVKRKLKVLQRRNLLLISFGVFLWNQLEE